MKINYDEITTKANERAENIKEFLDYAAKADGHAQNVLNGLLYFANLRSRAMAVDAEGKAMLGEANMRAQQVGTYTSDIYRCLTTSTNGSGSRNLLLLIESLK